VDRQLGLLEEKIERLQAMLTETSSRRERIVAKIEQLEAELRNSAAPTKSAVPA